MHAYLFEIFCITSIFSKITMSLTEQSDDEVTGEGPTTTTNDETSPPILEELEDEEAAERDEDDEDEIEDEE